MSGIVVPLSVALAAIYIALQVYIRATQDPREPPVVETALPFVTPILGLRKHTYYDYLRYAPPVSFSSSFSFSSFSSFSVFSTSKVGMR